jgi:hypothetical protein
MSPATRAARDVQTTAIAAVTVLAAAAVIAAAVGMRIVSSRRR